MLTRVLARAKKHRTIAKDCDRSCPAGVFWSVLADSGVYLPFSGVYLPTLECTCLGYAIRVRVIDEFQNDFSGRSDEFLSVLHEASHGLPSSALLATCPN